MVKLIVGETIDLVLKIGKQLWEGSVIGEWRLTESQWFEGQLNGKKMIWDIFGKNVEGKLDGIGEIGKQKIKIS